MLNKGVWILWFILPLLIFGLVMIYVFVAPLKVVQIDHHALYVSNYRWEVRIPFSQVGDVIDASCINIRPITVVLLTETEFGRRIVFMPKASLLAFFRQHPIVDELRDLMQQNDPSRSPRGASSRSAIEERPTADRPA